MNEGAGDIRMKWATNWKGLKNLRGSIDRHSSERLVSRVGKTRAITTAHGAKRLLEIPEELFLLLLRL